MSARVHFLLRLQQKLKRLIARLDKGDDIDSGDPSYKRVLHWARRAFEEDLALIKELGVALETRDVPLAKELLGRLVNKVKLYITFS